MSRLLIQTPSGYAAERAYAFRVLLQEFLGLEWAMVVEDRPDVCLRLADGGKGEVRVAEGLFRVPEAGWLTEASLPPEPMPWLVVEPELLRPPDGRIPAPYGSGGDGIAARVDSAGGHIGFDLFGAAFFFLSRYEELLPGARDEHGRFPAARTLAVRHGFLDRPVVNEYVDLLWAVLNRVWPQLQRSARQTRVFLTHDVDRPHCVTGIGAARLFAVAGADVLRRADPALAARRLHSWWETRRHGEEADLCNTFDWIMTQSEAHGLSSAFYFLAGRTDPRFDAGYRLEDPSMHRLLSRIAARGHEVGLHPSYETWRAPEALVQEFQHLRRVAEGVGVRQPAWGGRQHYLRWEAPTTWQHWEDAGLAYDSSVGFAERPGFRSGTCYEFPVFNLRTRRELRLRERPLVVMEVSLLATIYLGLDHEDTFAWAARLVEACRRHHGDFVLLWHNNNLVASRDRMLYQRLLAAATG
jgi:hypothetical protein